MGNSISPIYKVIALAGVIFILYFGSRNVLGTGWKEWDIAILATYVSCFAKLSKSPHMQQSCLMQYIRHSVVEEN
ncbi:MAG: hypothetical protein ACLS9K_08220 [Lachnospira eligens]